LDAMREAVLLSDSQLVQMGQRAQASVSEHTLAHGVERFVRYAQQSVNV
jgi:glycerol dehydrogenase-like iron-containing ADH family enzyme